MGGPRITEHGEELADEDIAEAHRTHAITDALTRSQRRRIAELDAKLERMLVAFEARFVVRTDQIDGRLIGGAGRLDEMEERLTARLEGLESSIAELLRRLPAER